MTNLISPEIRRLSNFLAIKNSNTWKLIGGISRSASKKSVRPGPCPTNQVAVVLPWLKCQQGTREAELRRPTTFSITAG